MPLKNLSYVEPKAPFFIPFASANVLSLENFRRFLVTDE
jgi:hypothetical protein